MSEKQPWDDPEHDVLEDLKNFKQEAMKVPVKVFRPVVNSRDAEVLIANGWVEGRDFEVYGEPSPIADLLAAKKTLDENPDYK